MKWRIHDRSGNMVMQRPLESALQKDQGSPSTNGDTNALNDIGAGIRPFLDRDLRPTFILDLDGPAPSALVYANSSLYAARSLHQALSAPTAHSLEYGEQSSTLMQWATSARPEIENPLLLGHVWTCMTLHGRWRVIAGSLDNANRKHARDLNQTQPVTPASEKDNLGHSLDDTALGNVETLGRFDVTDLSLGDQSSAFLHLFHTFDWAGTDLGPISSWSQTLRRLVNQVMIDPRPAAIYWGKERNTIYNERYLPVAGNKHPFLMGQRAANGWSEIWDSWQHSFRGDEGVATMQESAQHFLERNGYLEEMYATFSIIPLVGDDGQIAYYNPVTETTKQVLSDRRMSTLLWLGQCLATATDSRSFWQQLLKGLEPNHPDVPFAMLYTAASHERLEKDTSDDDSGRSERSSVFDSKQWLLEGTLGISMGHPGLPGKLDSDEAASAITPKFRNVIRAGIPTVLRVGDGTFPKGLIGEAKSRAFGDICDAAVVIPIGPSTRDNILGFLIVGINPRRVYDHDYSQFMQLLHRQVATSMASVVLVEEELRRNRIASELAAQDRIRLSKQLVQARVSAADNEMRFRNMSEMLPVAMFHFDAAGNVLYANQQWFEQTGHPRDAFYPLSWYNVILEDDHALMDKEWAKLGAGEPVNFEIRLKRPWTTPEAINGEKVQGETWILAAAYTLKDENGVVTDVLGALTDISRNKWAEAFLEKRMLEAVELKRQQEKFIDMTSHEMRNPLSAIILCADSIATCLSEFQATEGDQIQMTRDTLDNQAEAAQTIMLCAAHQKRIIDDVLTLSKLDSGLLLITPVEVKPAEAIEQALKMFNSELEKGDVSMRYLIDNSYHENKVDWVMLDPSRLLQVLINLLTNALKFTQTQKVRQINVTLRASTEPPRSSSDGVDYLSRAEARTGLPELKSTDEPVFLTIEVRDTGRGLTEHEAKLLFQRFSQANPKTHVEYGGSGLGLFISRELTELQGGEIGFRSKSGVGSTFEFYVRAVRCAAPAKVNLTHRTLSPGTGSRERSHSRRGTLSDGAVASLKAQIESESTVESIKTVEAVDDSGEHLLIVEDNLVNQRVMGKQLGRAGFNIRVANHGVEALDRIRETHFWANVDPGSAKSLSIILMDVEMPVMDGLTCTRKIRELQKTGEIKSHIPIVGVTANARAEQITAAKEAGMDTVVTKPFRMLELIPELERIRKLHSESSRR